MDIQLDLNTTPAQLKSPSENSSSHTAALNFLNSTSDSSSSLQPNIVCDKSSKPGHVIYNKVNRTLSIECADGLKVLCGGFRIGGKALISSQEFYNGYLSKKSEEEWFFT